jgi:hypothetical protein
VNRDFWRGALSVALIFGTLSFLDSVGSEPLPGWTKDPLDLDLPQARRVAVRSEVESPLPEPTEAEIPEMPEIPSVSISSDECGEDCDDFDVGYAWAAQSEVDDSDDCPERSERFLEGCKAYVDSRAEEDLSLLDRH